MVELDLGTARMVMMMQRQFAPALQWAAFADGSTVVSDTSAYVLRLIGAGPNRNAIGAKVEVSYKRIPFLLMLDSHYVAPGSLPDPKYRKGVRIWRP